VNVLQKQCKCGKTMTIRLRTVIYSGKVEIENVPVFSCNDCNSSEVFQGAKPDLTYLIGTLGSKPEKQQLPFQEYNELAHLMYMVSDKDHMNMPIESILEERINQLLDLLLLSGSLGDSCWTEDIRRRLAQIAEHTVPDFM
jgi:hypothetical protein